jgi:predicted MFS family arabinose efflux permease
LTINSGPRLIARQANFVEITILFTSFIAATYGFGVYLFSTILPDMKAELHFSYTEAGGFISLAQVGFLVAALTSSVFTHRIGARRLIQLSMLTSCLSLFGLIFVSQGWHIAVLLTIAAAAAAAVWVPMVAVAQELIPIKHQGKAIGLMSSGTAYGVFVNGLAVPILVPSYGWRAVWVCSATLACAFFVWGWARLSKHEDSRNTNNPDSSATPIEQSNERISIGQLFRHPSILMILVMMFLNGIACMPAQNYLMSYLRDDLGYDLAIAGRAWSAIGLFGMAGGFVMGALADKIGVKKSLTLTYLLLSVATALFLHHGSTYEVYLGAAIFGLAFNAIFGLVPAYVSLNFSKNTATLIFGLATVLLGVGSMIGNFYGGMMHDALNSFSVVFLISTLTALLLASFSFLLGRFKDLTT